MWAEEANKVRGTMDARQGHPSVEDVVWAGVEAPDGQERPQEREVVRGET